MEVRGDVRCYHCGHVSGWVEGDPFARPGRATFHPLRGKPKRADATLRCERCGGPVYLDDLETVNAHLGQFAAYEATRRHDRERPRHIHRGQAGAD